MTRKTMPQVKHFHHHYHFSYTTSFKRHFLSLGLVLLLLIFLFFSLFGFLGFSRGFGLSQISFPDLLKASIYTLMRLSISYMLCLIVSIPLALLITSTPRIEKVLLPLFDIIQSIPILAFFPLIVLIFIKVNLLEAAAVFVLFMSMLWGLTFNMVGGLKTIPGDVKDAALVFQATGLKKLRYITLPAIFPYIVTGSLLSWGAGWNILIVAEVLHTYIPGGTPNQDLFGLGSLLVNATYHGQTLIFISSIITMVILIGLLNFFVWQKLLNYGQRYKFD